MIHLPLLPPGQMGGMGFLHYNNTIEDQVAQLNKVKHHVPGYVVTPYVCSPQDTISKLDALKVLSGPCSRAPTALGAVAIGTDVLLGFGPPEVEGLCAGVVTPPPPPCCSC